MKKLLFTGASGFLGYNIRPILEKSYDVHTIGLTDDDDIKINMAKEVPPINTHYDVVLHAAGKAHTVPKTEAEKQVFYDVNYQGTVNLCKALENAEIPKTLIFISTVAVYGCEFGDMITEEHPLEGTSPYADSKIKAERYLQEWCAKNSVKLGILRPSLLAGKHAPGNLGAILRSADAAGADALIVCDPLTDLYNPNLIRNSTGAIFSVPCVACTSEECIKFLKENNIQILTAQLQDSELYYDTDMKRGTAIVMGTEATGLTDIWRKAADAHIRIPMLGITDSLNVSVSAAILLYEAVRQRKTLSPLPH